MSSTKDGQESEQGQAVGPVVSGSLDSPFRPSSPDVGRHLVENPLPASKPNEAAPSNQKRKSIKDYFQPEAKRRRTTRSCEQYRQLLNEIIQDVSTQNVLPEEEIPLRASQIGASYWTSEEKDALFRALPVLGRDNVTGIAARMKTKSPLEVAFYLQLLQRAMADRYLNKPDLQLLSIIDMPAAFEISQDCCDRLDQEAALLESRQSQEESCRERRKWNDLWLLTPDIGCWVESKLDEGTEGVNEVVNKLPAASLLKLNTWLELSERIFMNPGPPREDENWHSISETEEPPSIRATAFTDFANLAVSLTERLVQATLFQAQSRCRAIDSKHLARGYSVRVTDVHSACQVLGLQQNSRRFWTHAARRCGLNVYRHIREMDSHSTEAPSMAYEEIEEILGEKRSKSGHLSKESKERVYRTEAQSESQNNSRITSPERPTNTATVSPSDTTSQTATSSPSLQLDPSTSSTDQSDSDLDKPYSHEARLLAKRHARRELHRAQDTYMEALDQRNSSAEETRLWKILDEERPRTQEDLELPRKPLRDRKQLPDLVDWRERTDYWSEWETLDGPFEEEMFSRPIRRRTKPSQTGELNAETDSRDGGEPEMIDIAGSDSDSNDDDGDDDDNSDDSSDTHSEMDTSEGDDAMSVVPDNDDSTDSDDAETESSDHAEESEAAEGNDDAEGMMTKIPGSTSSKTFNP